MNISWYINRFKTMSPGEILFRVKQQYRLKKQKHFWQAYWPKNIQLITQPPKLLETNDLPIQSDILNETSWLMLGIDFDYSQPINWHEDFRSKKSFPLKFCREVNTRSEESGIAKYVWEPNRHQFLIRICYQYIVSGDTKFLDLFMEHISSWKEQNPYLKGVNWYSNIEVNIRLINWFLCWELLNVNDLRKKYAPLDEFVNNTWLPLIFLHCKYSSNNPSAYTSANNHLISEGVGLFIASNYWQFSASNKWKKHSRKIVEKEIHKQHSENGINHEQTSEYIQFITDYFLIAKVFAEKMGQPFSGIYDKKLEKILDYIYYLLDKNGNIWHYGDADEGRTFTLEGEHGFNNFISLMNTAYLLTSDLKYLRYKTMPDLKNRVLFGNVAYEKLQKAEGESQHRNSMMYREEGHFLLRKEDENKEVLLHFDAAPLGYLGIAAHGHADALSFDLTINGIPFLIDSGTYSYHSDMKWRNYFVSTQAHNTITIDNENQALRAGPTMWRKHYNCEIISAKNTERKDEIEVTHNGYTKEKGITHNRKLCFDKEVLGVSVVDHLVKGNDELHTAEMMYHFHPEIILTEDKKKSGIWVAKHPSYPQEVIIELPENMKWELIKGDEKKPLGWYSPAFYVKHPCNVLCGSSSVQKSITFNTQFQIKM